MGMNIHHREHSSIMQIHLDELEEVAGQGKSGFLFLGSRGWVLGVC